MVEDNLELVIDSKSELGEGPCWDEKNQKLLWIDGYAGKINIYDYVDQSNRFIEVGQYVGSINLRKDGGAILALQYGIYFLNLKTEKILKITDPEYGLSHNRLNDGKCDCKGRLWFGSINMDAHVRSYDVESTGALYCMNKDLEIRQVLDNIAVSNGLTWNVNNKIMYHINTPTRKVVAYDFNKETGEIKNKREIVIIPENQGVPDGMTIDEEGKLWVAHFGGYQVSRWDPETGEKIGKIKLPVKNVTSCTFGGKNLEELFITTASAGLSKKEASEQPQAGGLFKIRPGVKGLSFYRFGR